jgi:glucose-6-phosphate-specific signal transduction histidine kinase
MSQTTYPAQRTAIRGEAAAQLAPVAPAIAPNLSRSAHADTAAHPSLALQKSALHSLAEAEIAAVADDLTDLIAKLRASGLRVEREDVDEPFELSEKQRSSVYKIVQESLVNVLLHGARSEKTVVLFEWSPTALSLTVASALRKDPISLGAGEAFEGDGIPMMRKSTQLLGGEFNAHAGYGRWVVSVDFPRDTRAARSVESKLV